MSNPLGSVSPSGGTTSPSASQPISPQVSAFSRSVNSHPPTYAESMSAGNPGCPPPYTPADCSFLFNALPDNSEFSCASYEHCLELLNINYLVSFDDLAMKLSPTCSSGRFQNPVGIIISDLLGPGSGVRKNPELTKLARQLYTLFKTEENSPRMQVSKLNKRAFILCMFFLEQKKIICDREKPALENDTGLKLNAAALVRKEFFQLFDQLKDSSWLAATSTKQIVESFLNQKENASLRDDLELEVPISNDLNLSGLRLQDIPGAVVRQELRHVISSYNDFYNIDFFDLIEALGECRAPLRVFAPLPVRQLTIELMQQRDPKVNRMTLKEEKHFMDRNAVFIETAMKHFHELAFNNEITNNSTSHEVKKDSPSRQESLTGDQQKAAVVQNLMQLLLDRLKKEGLNNVRMNLTQFMKANWPGEYIPVDYRSGKMPT